MNLSSAAVAVVVSFSDECWDSSSEDHVQGCAVHFLHHLLHLLHSSAWIDDPVVISSTSSEGSLQNSTSGSRGEGKCQEDEWIPSSPGPIQVRHPRTQSSSPFFRPSVLPSFHIILSSFRSFRSSPFYFLFILFFLSISFLVFVCSFVRCFLFGLGSSFATGGREAKQKKI